MDMNYLHFRQQIELMRAGAAACTPSRLAHDEMAVAYGRLIVAARGPGAAPGLELMELA